MGRSYSQDLRDRIVSFVENGHSRRAAARHFEVSESFAVKLLQRVVAYGSGAPARQGRPPGGGKLAGVAGFLIGVVEARPDITMPELAARLGEVHNLRAAPAVLSRFLGTVRNFVVRQAKLARSSRWKSGLGKGSARPEVSVARWKATTTAKRTQRCCGVWD